MDKLIEFGRRAMFYVRVLSGYEERRIRSYRLQLQRRLQWAQQRKEALRKIPEQAILAEVRRMVEEMQTLNKKLEETEAAIEEYFKPIDKEAEILMKMQLDGEEKSMTEMLSTMEQQALLEKAEAEKLANNNQSVTSEDTQVKAIREMLATMQKQALLEKAEAEKLANNNQSVTSEDTQVKAIREMLATMQKQALLEKAEAEKLASNKQTATSEDSQDPASINTQKHAQMR